MKSLHLKVLVPLVVGIGCTTLAFTAVGALYERRVIEVILAQRSASLSDIIRHDITRVMRSGEPSEIQWVLNDLASNSDVSGVRLLAADGTVRRSTRPSEVSRVLADHLEQASPSGDVMNFAVDGRQTRQIVHSVEPLHNRPECLGCHRAAGPTIAFLDLDLDLTRERAAVQTWWIVNAALGVVQLLAIAAITYPVLGLLVGRPIRRLTTAMDEVQSGNLTTSVSPVGTREFDGLVARFNSMVRRLRDAAQREEQTRCLQLERAEQLATVGELAAGLAHEIRSPLSAVKAAVEVLADDLPIGDSRRLILRDSATELTRIAGVTRELLEYARPLPPSFAKVDLNLLVERVVALNQAQAAKQETSLVTVLDPRPLPVECDAGMVRQVLVNLTLNALQAVIGAEHRRVEVSTACDGSSVICRVRDTGPGIAVAQSDAIFKPFVTTKARGTGLGLAISRRLIEIQGGRLCLENAGHLGASFVFTLPSFGV